MNDFIKNYQPLYLKYRPQKLSELVGQKFICQTLTNAISQNRLSHAYLFTGPRGTGKTSTARILAKSVNCINGSTANPCNECERCIDIKIGSSTAVIELDAASNNSVDDARILIEKAPLSVIGGKIKFYIIDECHMLTKEAFNALLKTIEEPPPSVIFVLATTEEQKVPQTILSRCQKLSFKFIAQPELINHLTKICELENYNIAADAIQLIARRAQGGLRDALTMLDQASLLSSCDYKVSHQDLVKIFGVLSEESLNELSQYIHEENSQSMLKTIENILQDGREPAVIITELTKHFLNLAKAYFYESKDIEQLNSIILGSKEYINKIIVHAQDFEYKHLIWLTQFMSHMEQEIKRAPNPTIFLEIKLLSAINKIDYLTNDNINERITKLENLISEDNYVFNKTPSIAAKPVPTKQKTLLPETTLDLAKISVSLTASSNDQNNQTAKMISNEVFTSSTTAINDSQHIETKPTNNSDRESEGILSVNNTIDQEEIIPGSDSNDSQDFWSKLLTELQNLHMPTYSLILSQAHFISLINEELSIGVAATLQKTLEKKQDYIIKAGKNITGKVLSVRIKVQDKKKPLT